MKGGVDLVHAGPDGSLVLLYLLLLLHIPVLQPGICLSWQATMLKAENSIHLIILLTRTGKIQGRTLIL